MNRKQKRRFMNAAKKRGIDKSVSDIFLRLKERDVELSSIGDGDLVQLNITSIQSFPDYPKLSASYRQFVESSAGKIFTAQLESDKYGNGLICLKEDSSGWHFWPGDLIKVSE